MKGTQGVLLTKGSAANYTEGFTNVLATKKQQCSTRGSDGSSPSSAFSVLQDSASVEGALDSKIVAAIVRKIAKLSSEAGGSGKFENSGRLPYAIVATTKGDRYS